MSYNRLALDETSADEGAFAKPNATVATCSRFEGMLGVSRQLDMGWALCAQVTLTSAC